MGLLVRILRRRYRIVKKMITLTLTPEEARALARVTSEIIDHPKRLAASLPHVTSQDLAVRGHSKLVEAVQRYLTVSRGG